MKLLFLMRHAGYVRNFESTLRLLCERGHRVHLAFQGKVKYAQLDPANIAGQLADTYTNFSYGEAHPRVDPWGLVGRELRLGLDYLRYLGPAYDQAPKLRERAGIGVAPAIVQRAQTGAVGRHFLAATLRLQNRAIPRSAVIDSFLQEQQPDVLAVTPLIEPGSPQSEYLRSARGLGIRTAYCVASWDNLTNKGLIHGPVDLVTVWNEAMKDEAVRMHGVPAGRVAVTGAAAFDHWFDWRPGRTRAEFLARVHLPADRPFLLYVCSSKFVAPEEVSFVRTWLEKMRRGDGPLRDAGVLVRPHPQNADQWEAVDFGDLGPVAIWPRAGAAPVDEQTRSDYFESIHYCAAVVGLNTTAEIESAIVGRPVFTLLTPEFRDTQTGTLHFDHLRRVNGGLLQVAEDFDEHFRQLTAALRGTPERSEQSRRFVEAFVRPHGLNEPATPRLVRALEELAAQASRPEREPVWAPMVRRRLAPMAERLEREVQKDPGAYADRKAAKGARELRRHARDAERRARLEKKVRETEARRAVRGEEKRRTRQQRLEGAVLDFHDMDEVDRRNFIRTVVDDFPLDSFIEIQAANKPRRLDYDRAEIYLRVTSKTETFRIKACAKEPYTIDWIHSRMRGGDVVYDIGANVGAYSLVAAKQPGGVRVFAFEASYANVGSLCANIVLNDVATLVTPMPFALSGRTAMSVFNLRDPQPGGARHILGDHTPADGPPTVPQPVLMYRLDDLVEAFELPLPNHIKLDVDGGELDVLAGAARTLASPSLESLLVEVSVDLSAAVEAALATSGLRLESKILKQNKAGEVAVWYGLFGRTPAGTDVVTTVVKADTEFKVTQD